MVTKSRNYNLADLAKQSTVKTSHTLRLQADENGVGLMTFATYCGEKFAGSLIAKSAAAINDKAIKYEKDNQVIVCSGKWGAVVRIAQVSTCGNYALRNGKVIALNERGDGDFVAYSLGTLEKAVEFIKSGELYARDYFFKSLNGAFETGGIGFSSRENWHISKGSYASLCFISGNGKIVFHDCESGSNAYNKGTDVLGVQVAGDAAKAGADKVRNFAFSNATRGATVTTAKAKAASEAKKKVTGKKAGKK